MPPVGNGFSFVMDQRPQGRENDHIPPEDYTRYFSQRQIPLAPKGHLLHDHDIGHVHSYQTIFAITDLANVIQTAATNSLASPELCQIFTSSMDQLGNCMRNLENDRYSGVMSHIGNVNGAGLHLRRIADLAYSWHEGESSNDRWKLVKELSSALQLPYYRTIATHDNGMCGLERSGHSSVDI